MLFQGGSGRFDLTVGPKQTMGKVVSMNEWMTLYFNRVHKNSQDCSLPYGPMKVSYSTAGKK